MLVVASSATTAWCLVTLLGASSRNLGSFGCSTLESFPGVKLSRRRHGVVLWSPIFYTCSRCSFLGPRYVPTGSALHGPELESRRLSSAIAWCARCNGPRWSSKATRFYSCFGCLRLLRVRCDVSCFHVRLRVWLAISRMSFFFLTCLYGDLGTTLYHLADWALLIKRGEIGRAHV